MPDASFVKMVHEVASLMNGIASLVFLVMAFVSFFQGKYVAWERRLILSFVLSIAAGYSP